MTKTNLIATLLWRWKLNRHFKRLKAPMNGDVDIDINKVWQGIEPELSETRANSAPSFNKKPIIALVAASTALMIWWNGSDTSKDYLGIKGMPSIEHKFIPTPVLRFAVINRSGELNPGYQNMSLTRNSRIIFSVEESRKDVFDPYQLTLWVSHTDNKKTMLKGYQVTQNKEILQGKNGYLSLLLDTKGVYEFTGQKQVEGGEVQLKGFRIYVD